MNKLKIENEKSLKNLYSSFTNFKKYNLSDSYKNPEFYMDLVCRPGFIFDEPVNLLILEKTSYDEDSQINLVCPKSFLGSQHINLSNNTIILLNTGDYYEPIIGIRFIDRKLEIDKTIEPFEPIIFFNSSETTENQISRKNITTIMKLLIENCDEKKEDYKNNIFKNNLLNLFEIRKIIKDSEISKYIIGNNLKILAIKLINNLILPIIPSGLTEDIIPKLGNNKDLKRNILSISEFESIIDKDDRLNSYKINKFISFQGKIHSLLLDNGTVIPIKKEDIDGRTTIDFEDVEVDNLIIDRIEEQDDRVKFNLDYNNYIQEQNIVRYIFNSFIREVEQEDTRDFIKKIIVNPVLPMMVKKRKLLDKIENIVDELFIFKTNPDIFGKSKKTKKCYNSKNVTQGVKKK